MTPLSLMSLDVVQSDLTVPLRLACSYNNETRLDLWRNAHTSVTLRISPFLMVPWLRPHPSLITPSNFMFTKWSGTPSTGKHRGSQSLHEEKSVFHLDTIAGKSWRDEHF